MAAALRNGQRLHQLPAREVGDADIAKLAGADQVVEGRQHLLDRRAGIEGMQLQQIDIIGAEPAQRRVGRPDQARPRCAGVIRALTQGQRGLGRDQNLVAAALDGLAQH
jgi:hypothetical protein